MVVDTHQECPDLEEDSLDIVGNPDMEGTLGMEAAAAAGAFQGVAVGAQGAGTIAVAGEWVVREN